MNLLKVLFGSKSKEPDPIATQVRNAAEQAKRASNNFAGLMGDLLDEQQRIKRHMAETQIAPIIRSGIEK